MKLEIANLESEPAPCTGEGVIWSIIIGHIVATTGTIVLMTTL